MIHKNQLAIITETPVDKTFEGVDAYLHAEILPVKDDPINQLRQYKVRTDLAIYEDVVIGQDEQGNDIVETQLVIKEEKQNWALQQFYYAEIDAFAGLINQQVPEGLTQTQEDNLKMQIMFLLKRQQDAPWGVEPNLWRLRTEADLKQ